MKILFGLPAVFGMYYFIYECNHVAGQYAEDVTKNFVPLTFAQVHRGSFNISNCVRELLNCWEVIKPDFICTDRILFESVCGVLRQQCTDAEHWVSRLLRNARYHFWIAGNEEAGGSIASSSSPPHQQSTSAASAAGSNKTDKPHILTKALDEI